MAWTNPKTWARLDPLNADNLNREVRDNLLYLKQQQDTTANVVHRVRTVSGSDASLSTDDDVFGSPLLDLTIGKATANVMAGCQATFREPSAAGSDFDILELRLRCYQAGTPPKTVDVYLDHYIQDGGIISLAPSSLFLGFSQGTVSFSVTLSAGGPMNLLTGDHTIWAMEL